ncbi:bifunctional 5,10-methylenetetrahydrofolate dehydrogenase/5,10-methenyltetrahydrofolate cyclohydrolase [Alicyclobacillus sp. ALC3]|uniref:bifunctional 5,10-methylenetetrahydrofolate dehydrogenase/5,10-methenyltetrahydrofolate cyclohydrolase n=1 Tax=Alicyclobacillus sp. ALC3 TaxID=2796143 RepID=UPI002379B048|nr:bifunctional 5,10-methylenetetrahydrofolate dehydrogenase/5,10-methenyltetrahydrofolate cyclohydrolase [Alicyclobacillus sp. ALC3]WDL98345.1 bifunctional 5,10-methylenetetrahydrofolate dehydrogenase/5,10-methenyltetrahydrofolate cyclohydrolase [Alicyclobacillus sp. ALC3]
MSTAAPTTQAALLSGVPVAESIRTSVLKQVRAYHAKGVTPTMVTVLVQGDAASAVYARQKARMGKRLGIEVEVLELDASATQDQLSDLVRRLSQSPDIHGIMLELPLPEHIQLSVILEQLDPRKDVDGLTDVNRMANITGDPGVYPATPLACLALIDHYDIEVKGREVVLIGCGKTVGSPLFHGLIRKGATVTVCTEHTRDLKSHLQRVPLAVVAVGAAGLIQPEMVHEDLILIDAGMSELPDGRMVGDVSPAVADYVAALTPTPGGVGKVTTMQLFSNLLRAMSLQQL